MRQQTVTELLAKVKHYNKNVRKGAHATQTHKHRDADTPHTTSGTLINAHDVLCAKCYVLCCVVLCCVCYVLCCAVLVHPASSLTALRRRASGSARPDQRAPGGRRSVLASVG